MEEHTVFGPPSLEIHFVFALPRVQWGTVYSYVFYASFLSTLTRSVLVFSKVFYYILFSSNIVFAQILLLLTSKYLCSIDLSIKHVNLFTLIMQTKNKIGSLNLRLASNDSLLFVLDGWRACYVTYRHLATPAASPSDGVL